MVVVVVVVMMMMMMMMEGLGLERVWSLPSSAGL
jgi:hypothetical protein